MQIKAKMCDGRITYCRWKFPKHKIERGEKYISVTGQTAGNGATLCVCEEHAIEFFEAVNQAETDLDSM